MHEDIDKILISEEAIQKRLEELAAQITADYRGKDLTVLAILNGSFVLLADLLRKIPLPLTLQCLLVSSYNGSTSSSGRILFRQNQLPDLSRRHVLVLDDILDTGLTLASILEKLHENPDIASIKTCVLLKKEIPRPFSVDVDYIGFSIGNQFVVGYGLDYKERYRNLPYIGILKPGALK
jgi:hypoxanthine phosphoribosyltransferase